MTNTEHPVNTDPGTAASEHGGCVSAASAKGSQSLAHSQRALRVASEHLRHAGLSHDRACSLQARGKHLQACEQSRMTQVFLSNAIYHLQQHALSSARP